MKCLKSKKVIGFLIAFSLLISLNHFAFASTRIMREIYVERAPSSVTMIVNGHNGQESNEIYGMLNGRFPAWLRIDDQTGKYISNQITYTSPMLAYGGSKIISMGIVSSTLINDSRNCKVVYEVSLDGGTVVKHDDNYYHVTVIY